MKVLMVPNEAIAALLQDLVKPGIEVVAIGQDIDSQTITSVAILAPKELPPMSLIMDTASRVKGRTTPMCELNVFAV